MSETEIVDSVRQWLLIFAFIGVASFIWVLSKSERRNRYMKDGKLDIRAFWREYRATYGAGIIAFFVVFASMLGVVIGGAIFS